MNLPDFIFSASIVVVFIWITYPIWGYRTSETPCGVIPDAEVREAAITRLEEVVSWNRRTGGTQGIQFECQEAAELLRAIEEQS